MNILIINGINLDLLGRRETAIYGTKTFEEVLMELHNLYPNIVVDYFQSNEEEAIVEKIQQNGEEYTALVINGGAFTHTSVAIAEAVRSIAVPAIEVHISNIHAREEFRRKSFLSSVCKGSIIGLGTDVYRLAVEHIINSI
jgi:3-dehydroquinate dehydratase-2